MICGGFSKPHFALLVKLSAQATRGLLRYKKAPSSHVQLNPTESPCEQGHFDYNIGQFQSSEHVNELRGRDSCGTTVPSISL